MFVGKNGVLADDLHPDYVVTLKEGRWDDRTDGKKWSHPEALSVYEMTTEESGRSVGRMCDPGRLREERKKEADAEGSAIDEYYLTLPHPNTTREKHTIKGLCEGDPDLEIIICRPINTKKKVLPVLFTFGQGSMVENNEAYCYMLFERFAYEADVAVVYAKARTGADVWFPKPLDDYQAAYAWLIDNQKTLGVDGDNIVLAGNSGGGYVALCFAFRCKKVGFKPKGVLANIPVMGDDFRYPSSRIVTGIWDVLDVQHSFKSIIRPGDENSPFVDPEIIPSRATVEDCKGLCPVYIHTNELDSCRDAGIAFANKCMEAKVWTQLHNWAGMVHGGLTMGESRIHKAFQTVYLTEIQDMFEFDFRREWLNEG